MSNVVPIVIQKEGISDDYYIINELYLDNGVKVQKGDLIFCFETSKTTIDIESPSDGYIFYDITANQEVKIGQTVAVISDQEEILQKDWFKVDETKEEVVNQYKNIKISKPAQKLINEHKIDVSEFHGLSLVTKEDVKNYLSKVDADVTELEVLEPKDNSIIIFGGGGHARMCIDTIKQIKKHTIIGIVDDNIPAQTKILEIPVLGKSNILEKLRKTGVKNSVVGVGGAMFKGLREDIFNKLKKYGFKVPTIIHPSASIEPSATIEEGSQIMQGAIIGSNVRIGKNCIINSGCILSHDTIIGDNVHVAPGAILGGEVKVNNNAVIGMGCTVFLGVTIGENVVINNGDHVFNDLFSSRKHYK